MVGGMEDTCTILLMLALVCSKVQLMAGFPDDSGKETTRQCRTWGSFLCPGRSPGEGNDNPLQCSHLGNPKDRRAWLTIVPKVANTQT